MDGMSKFTLLGAGAWGFQGCVASINGELRVTVVVDEGSTQARVRNKTRNNDLRSCFGCASVSVISLYLAVINHLSATTYRDRCRTENPCVGARCVGFLCRARCTRSLEVITKVS